MITIDFSSTKSSLCDSIYSQIKQQILRGKLKASEKLPSKRAFADHLGVSVITVQNAYDLLIGEGFIYSIEKKGYFVTDVASQKLLSVKDASSVKIENYEENNIDDAVSYYADFESNATSSEKFPFNLWARTMRQVLNSGDEKLLCRVGVKGVLELREAIARYLMEYRNMQVSPNQIVIGAGTESLYSMLVQLLGRGKKYAVENPGYHKVADIVELNGAFCVPVNIDKSGMNIKALLESDCEVVHVSPFHHFPTGIVMPIKRRLELLAWAEKSSSRYIIEDDYDSEFRFNGKPMRPLQSFDSSSRVIYINTFSKTLSPSFRISYMVLPKSLVKDFDKKLGFYSCPVSSFEQFTLASFINNGDFGKHITRMRNYYRSVRNELINTITSSSLSALSSIKEEEAGLHFLLKIDEKINENTILNWKQKLLDKGINIPLLSSYFYNPCSNKDNHIFVLNYSAIKKDRIAEIVKRMESVFNDKL